MSDETAEVEPPKPSGPIEPVNNFQMATARNSCLKRMAAGHFHDAKFTHFVRYRSGAVDPADSEAVAVDYVKSVTGAFYGKL